jgi:predicted RNA-binding protein with PUA-like domain
MAFWLFKEEPTHYSFAKLQRAGKTKWDGVTNNLARKHLRQVQGGDLILFYHTGKEKAVVGVMRAASDAREAPTKADQKAVMVEVEAVRPLPHPVSLARIKADPSLATWELVRLSRLSVMPATEAQWRRVEELSATEK